MPFRRPLVGPNDVSVISFSCPVLLVFSFHFSEDRVTDSDGQYLLEVSYYVHEVKVEGWIVLNHRVFLLVLGLYVFLLLRSLKSKVDRLNGHLGSETCVWVNSRQ